MASQKKYGRQFSFEFFPARSPEAKTKLEETLLALSALEPDFFSVTFGAGGGSRDYTFETIEYIRAKTSVEAVPHISCIGMTNQEIVKIISGYRLSGIKKLLVLRGDMPSGSAVFDGQFRHAYELVEFIRQQSGDHFHIEVAGYPEFHPQSKSPSDDLRYLKGKVDAGANGVVTQYFYNPDAYFRFVENCEKMMIDVPIVPGVMPITNCTGLSRFSEACGAEVPRWILKRLQEFGDDRSAICKFGMDVVTELCDHLLSGGAPGLHFYTMNQSEASLAIWKNLNLGNLERRI